MSINHVEKGYKCTSTTFLFFDNIFFSTSSKNLFFSLQSFLQVLKICGIHAVDQILAFYKKEQTAFTIQILHC